MQTTSNTPLRRLPSGALDATPYIIAARAARAEEFRILLRAVGRFRQRVILAVLSGLQSNARTDARAAKLAPLSEST